MLYGMEQIIVDYIVQNENQNPTIVFMDFLVVVVQDIFI